MADFPAYCGRCDDIVPHDYPNGSAFPPHCMRCLHGPGFRATHAPLTPAARKRLRGMRPDEAARIAKEFEMRDSSFGPWAILAVLALAALAIGIAAASGKL